MREAQRSMDPVGVPAQVRSQGPTVLRIALGAQLRRLREARGITTEAAGYTIRTSHAKISRIELGRISFKDQDVADLLTLYGVTDTPRRGAFLALAQQANAPGWWHRYSDILPDWFDMYLGLEQTCAVIRSYEPQLVPGLLQTRKSARAAIQLSYPNESTDDIECRSALRMARQETLIQSGRPNLWAVIGEAALWRFDERSAIREQIQHLIDMAELPNITLQVIPFYSGGHVAIGGPFSILRFSEPDLPDIVYLEQLTGALYLDEGHDVQHYLVGMDRLCVQAKSPAETTRFLNSTLKEL
ncbi:MAG TPA: helix-turn-helix transcriptional regulator [Pseudonocardiaceae bacterium]|nr:helix-turn-helix transcriptional regulator [Pseudonocardiaceae bacterium]